MIPAPPPKGAPKPGTRPRPAPKGPQLPDLSATAKNFPKGPDAGSPKILNKGPRGRYRAVFREDRAFPNRTIYHPLNVAPGERVPILAWENGLCYLYGRMYQEFLREIASHGYLVVAPGAPNNVTAGRTSQAFQQESVQLARAFGNSAPFSVDTSKVALAGHSCGGGETLRNLATVDTEAQVATGLIFNSGGSQQQIREVVSPMLWVHGGLNDTQETMERNLEYVERERPDLRVALVGLQTGHLGSFWSPRGGIYAETAVKWLDATLKNDLTSQDYFVGGPNSPAAKRGWEVDSNGFDS